MRPSATNVWGRAPPLNVCFVCMYVCVYVCVFVWRTRTCIVCYESFRFLFHFFFFFLSPSLFCHFFPPLGTGWVLWWGRRTALRLVRQTRDIWGAQQAPVLTHPLAAGKDFFFKKKHPFTLWPTQDSCAQQQAPEVPTSWLQLWINGLFYVFLPPYFLAMDAISVIRSCWSPFGSPARLRWRIWRSQRCARARTLTPTLSTSYAQPHTWCWNRW